MWRGGVVLCALVTCAVACRNHAEKPPSVAMASEEPITKSPSGQFRGSWMTSRRGRRFQAYRGIKYAEPPVGNLRFQPPKPILSYQDEVNATEDGPACPLPAPPSYPVDEDCLTINVYTPNNNGSELLPVIFFIHPGGFYSMTGRSDLAGPHYLLDHDVVLVTINYRLGSLGFLSTGDRLAPGNNGFKDQVAALKWVQRNIQAFGGEPGLVTLAGSSAGSISVLFHMISPMSKGLFHRGISMSGSPIGNRPLPRDLFHLAVKQAELVNCPTDNSSVIIECLKTKPFRELGDSLFGFREFGMDPVGIWDPVHERDFGQERFMPLQPDAAIREQRLLTPVPYIISQTTDEFFWGAYLVLQNETLMKTMNEEWERIAQISFQLPSKNLSTVASRLRREYLHDQPLVNSEASARALGKIYGDSLVGFNTYRLANLMSRHSPHKVWYYEFAYIGNHSHYEDPVTSKPKGAAHHDDLIYLFSLSYRYPAIPADDSPDSKMVDKMTKLWYDFARFGDVRGTKELGQDSVDWPNMTPRARVYLRIGDEWSVHSNLKEDRFKIWEELYPMQY
uniref:Carboxylic ester hydrolase n=1 Tax=Cnaphalocrocis medinalis TaxID=437488 RepID=A0A0C5CGX5_CNAME|nr:carboxylesterase [Cnaphalocrocis medinalis]